MLRGARHLLGSEPFGTEVEAQLAAAINYGAIDLDAGAFEGVQSGGNVFDLPQGGGEGQGVFGGFGDSGGNVRAANEGSVTEEGDTAEGHARGLDVVDGLKKGLGRELDAVLELGCEQPFRSEAQILCDVAANERGWNRKRMRVAGFVGEKVAEFIVGGGAIPDEIVAAMAWAKIVVRTCNGIAKELLAGRKAEGESVEKFGARFGREGGFVDESAPGDVAGILRLHFGKNVRAHGRAEAVGADEKVGFDMRVVTEMDRDGIGVRFDALQFPAEMVAIGGKFFAQHAENAIPRSDDLRTGERGEEMAGGIESFAPGDGHAKVFGGIEAAGLNDGAKLGMRDDARATPGKFNAGALANIDGPAELAQKERGEKSGHGAADNDGSLRSLV